MTEAASPSATPFAPLLARPEVLEDPYPLYAALRRTTPVLRLPFGPPDSPGVWVLTRYEDCQAVLRDPGFSADRRRSWIVREGRSPLPPSLLDEESGLRSMLVMDPPDHTRVRGLVSRAFTPRRVASLAPRIEALVDELLDRRTDRKGIELIGEFASPLPATVIAELLGVPVEDQARFRGWAAELVTLTAGAGDPAEIAARVERSLGALLDYLRGIIAERRRAPRDDLISGMIQAQVERDALSDAELLATSNLLLIAGFETTTNLIGNGVLALLRSPGELERLRARPELLPGAVEELLRYDSPVQGTGRVALRDVTLGGHRIPEGALVIPLLGAANRDPEVFPDPDRLDLAREENRHLSFGFGAHFCLGAPLARLEGRLALAGLLRRFDRIELAEERVRHRPNFFLRGLEALPLAVEENGSHR